MFAQGVTQAAAARADGLQPGLLPGRAGLDRRARRAAAGRAIIDANERYFNVAARCARSHKNDFFIDHKCFFESA
ncbi:hypothetical protein DLM46_06145 [Paraburkholderia lacunae]|uniref:Uncharacterized protein n=1 Tax=Paraburkholderia lacunae TaxID=2211104 RepID=A0A370NDX3_9BURK|nr:hypothetical protein DLM46_06145 [Paraburkholderia lacunae]